MQWKLGQISVWRRMILAVLRVDVSFTDAEILSLDRPIIMICNHQSMIDGLILAFASPVRMVFPVTPKYSIDNSFTRRGLRFLEHLGLGWVVPLNSEHPFALRHLKRALEAGRSVAIFPEGRIAQAGETLPYKEGVKWLQSHSDAQLVIATLTGADQSRLFAVAGTKLLPAIKLEITKVSKR